MAVSRVDESVPTSKEKPVCFFFLLPFAAFVGWHLVFFTSGLCRGWRRRNQSGWEGLLGGEPPEGMSVFIKLGDGDFSFYKLH